MNATHLFREAILKAGLPAPDEIIPDAKLHRFGTNGKRYDTAGWYVLFPDPPASGAFGCWREGSSHTWSVKNGDLTQAERETLSRRAEEARRQREEEQEREHAEAAAKAQDILNRSAEANDDHRYLKRKDVRAYPGMHQGFWAQRKKSNCLLIPIRDVGGKLWSLQAIYPESDPVTGRDKDFLIGGKKQGCFFMIGEPQKVICIAEGYATAWTVFDATEMPTAVAFDAGNLIHVACALRSRWPMAEIIICGDRGDGEDKARAAAAAVGGKLVIPDFAGLEATAADTDFNDLSRLAVPSRVQDQVFKAVEGESQWEADQEGQSRCTLRTITHAEILTKEYPETQWLVEDLIPTVGVTLFVGTLKIGKSWLALGIAQACSYGVRALGRYQCLRVETLYLALEDYERRIRKRFDKILEDGQGSLIHFLFGFDCKKEERLSQLDLWLGQHKEVRLVIVDTLQRFRGYARDKGDQYAADTETVGALQALAFKHNMAILICHHTRKAEADDWVEKVLGTQGLAGSADTVMMVTRSRGEEEGVLHITGKDIEDDSDLAIKFNRASCQWTVLGEAGVVLRSKEQQEIINVIGEDAMTLNEITKAVGKKYPTVQGLVDKLVRDGILIKGFDKRYRVDVNRV